MNLWAKIFCLLMVLVAVLTVSNSHYAGIFIKFNKSLKIGFELVVLIITVLTIFFPKLVYKSDLFWDVRSGSINKLPKHKIQLKMPVTVPNANNYVGGTKKKRKVTESTKKHVASEQKWKCKSCNELLDSTYEIDHVKPLYKGGSNDFSNLQALCRNCHGKKTLADRL